MDVGFSRMDQPGCLVHFIPGADSAHTGLTKLFLLPEGAFGPCGVNACAKGLVWTATSSGHLASFDSSRCRAPLEGLDTVTGKQCMEGWTLYRPPGLQFQGVDAAGSANQAYHLWVDQGHVMQQGLGHLWWFRAGGGSGLDTRASL